MRQPAQQAGPPQRRVAVLIGSSLTWREQVMRGIAGYANEQGRWHVYSAPEGAEESVFFSDRYKWDGLIVRPAGGRFVRRVLALKVPAVSVGSARVAPAGLPRVKVDDDELTRLALRHLLSGGFKRFAYCSFLPTRAEDRGPAFAAAAAGAGYPCASFQDFDKHPADDSWQRRQRALARWVSRLEKPVGILAWNPDVACQLVEACHLAGVAVPGAVAVIAADDDRVKCELTKPTVSAVELPAARIGYEAAALLDHLMRGDPPPDGPVLVRPSGVVTVRESSDVALPADRDVHQAAQVIRERHAGKLTVPEVASAVQVSRRWLERHFRRVLGRSPHEEIARARMETAKRLLLETDWPAAKVALRAGFSSASYLNHALRRDAGLTPLSFRRRYRLGGAASPPSMPNSAGATPRGASPSIDAPRGMR